MYLDGIKHTKRYIFILHKQERMNESSIGVDDIPILELLIYLNISQLLVKKSQNLQLDVNIIDIH